MNGPRLYTPSELMEIVTAMSVKEAEKELAAANVELDIAQRKQRDAYQAHLRLYVRWQEAESKKADKSLAWRICFALDQAEAVLSDLDPYGIPHTEISDANLYLRDHHMTATEKLRSLEVCRVVRHAGDAAIAGPGSPLLRAAQRIEEASILSKHKSIDEKNVYLTLAFARSALWMLLKPDERKVIQETCRGPEYEWTAIQKMTNAQS